LIKKLLTPEELFDTFFKQWYKQKEHEEMGVKPDMIGYANPGTTVDHLKLLTDEGIEAISKHMKTMINSAEDDWKVFLDVKSPLTIDDIEKFDNYYDEDSVLNLLNSSDPEDFSNDFIVTCCEFGAVLGSVMINMNKDLEWLYSHPYWESAIYDKNTGFIINVFSWAMCKFTDYGIEDGYKFKLLKCLEILSEEKSNCS
jgi:hypothetical protein